MSQSHKFYHSYLNNAAAIIQAYDGSIPFSHFIKNYFSRHKKFGSKDRKQVSQLCYAFFRLGKSFPDLPVKERILTALQYNSGPVEPQWNDLLKSFNLPSERPCNIFPWKDELSEPIDIAAFEASFAIQPDLFLRIRPGHQNTVTQKLNDAGISFTTEGTSVRLNNAVNIDNILKINKEVVVQDLSSQKMGQFLEIIKDRLPQGHAISVYDCCAASGGKSILAKDILKNIELTVSDIRPSIIENLKRRFQQAGIDHYNCSVLDIANHNSSKTGKQFDLVIADVPCTGSGTWARTPEQLYYFNKEKIGDYSALQKKILHNVQSYVKPGGYLLYITCSVFRRENEQQIQDVLSQAFILQSMQLIQGATLKSDTLFGCLLQKN